MAAERGSERAENGSLKKIAIIFDHLDGLRYIWYQWKEEFLENLMVLGPLAVIVFYP